MKWEENCDEDPMDVEEARAAIDIIAEVTKLLSASTFPPTPPQVIITENSDAIDNISYYKFFSFFWGGGGL